MTPLHRASFFETAPRYVGLQLTVSTLSYQPRLIPRTTTGAASTALAQVDVRDARWISEPYPKMKSLPVGAGKGFPAGWDFEEPVPLQAATNEPPAPSAIAHR